MGEALDQVGHQAHRQSEARDFFRAAPAACDPDGLQPGLPLRQLDDDRENGVIRAVEHAFSQDGGLAVLYGNIALDGCIVKTAGVDDSILKFTGRARIFESQDSRQRILTGKVKPATWC
jgi:dihydroxy-acid dehydratase